VKLLARILGGLVLLLVIAAVAGWALLRRPDIPYDDLEAKYASPASKFMDLPGGIHLHYRDEGRRDGPTLVLVHGYGAALQAWEPWVTRLGTDYRIITLDLPGHGLTRTPRDFDPAKVDFVSVVDQVTTRLGVTKFVLGGNSMGGGVAWNYALAHPDKLAGLILVDAAGWDHPPGKNGVMLFNLLRNPVFRAVFKDLDQTAFVTQGLKAAYIDQSLVTPELVSRYTDLSRAPGHRDILLGMTGRSPATPQRLAAIQVPTLVMHGRQDTVIPYADAERFAAAIPHSTLIGYAGVGHVPMEQMPDRSAADVCAWLSDEVWPEKGSCGLR
jgi:pimeloyl-ACP methyl ester carboxylesterase